MSTILQEPAGAIGAALFGAARQGVLRIVYSHVEQRFYQRQLIRMLGLGSGAVQRELSNLTRAGIITRTVEGRQTYFQANHESPIFEELRALVRKTFGVAAVLRDALQPLAGNVRIAFIFGSVAAGREKAGSDIDLMVVGDHASLDEVVSALADSELTTGREINPSVYPTAEFCRKLAAGHHFLTSVMTGPKIFLIGSESELTGLAQIRMAPRASNQQGGNRRSAGRGRAGS